jgi:2-polyprenyl-3-methyl-5-hydroxy-6-metoxy-1,4-benzoquinol methylase
MENKGHSPDYTYADYNDRPDPSHRPLYLATILRYLRNAGSIRTVLDVGCGGGDFAEGLARNGFQVCGVDLSKSGIGAATAQWFA